MAPLSSKMCPKSVNNVTKNCPNTKMSPKFHQKMSSFVDFQNRTDYASNSTGTVGRRTLKKSINNESQNNNSMKVEYNDEETSDFHTDSENVKIQSQRVSSEDDDLSKSNNKQTVTKKNSGGFFGFGAKDATSDEEEVEESPQVEKKNDTKNTNISSSMNAIPDYLQNEKTEPEQTINNNNNPSLLWRSGSALFGGVKAIGGFGIGAVTTVVGGSAKLAYNTVTTVGSGAVTVVKGTTNAVIHPVETSKNAVNSVATGASTISSGTVNVVKGAGNMIGSGVSMIGSGVKNTAGLVTDGGKMVGSTAVGLVTKPAETVSDIREKASNIGKGSKDKAE